MHRAGAEHFERRPLEVRIVNRATELEIEVAAADIEDDERRMVQMGGDEQWRASATLFAAPLRDEEIPGPIARQQQIAAPGDPGGNPRDDPRLAPGCGGDVGQIEQQLLVRALRLRLCHRGGATRDGASAG